MYESLILLALIGFMIVIVYLGVRAFLYVFTSLEREFFGVKPKDQNKGEEGMIRHLFDTPEEVENAMKNLSDYHDCKKCHGKMVVIISDDFGNSKCGYCNEIVKYPKLSKKGYERDKKRFIEEHKGKGDR